MSATGSYKVVSRGISFHHVIRLSMTSEFAEQTSMSYQLAIGKSIALQSLCYGSNNAA